MANDINNLKRATKNKADEFYTRMEDIQKAIMDTDYQKELLQEYGIGE